MPKNVLRGLSIVLGVLFLYGCTATKNVEVRRYIEVKDRLDQNMEGGNAGYLSGTPQPEDRSGIRKTRKIYVLEVSQGVDEESEGVIAQDNEAMIEEEDYEEEGNEGYVGYDSQEETMIPSFDEADMDVDEDVVSEPSFKEYTIQKDDTMQKISKKFYNSYSKWPKIYDANKDVISDPNKIKPGLKLRIPME